MPEEEEFSYDYEEVDGEYYDEEDAIEEEGQNAEEATRLGKKVMERRKVSMSGSHITNLSKNQEINKIVFNRWLKHINRLQ